ncbi:recombination regulator RecX [Arsenicicoccus piscis]|uniref:Regulatory protein RecX n=1 Tax=Arsenicicoccus piscis TaxID=673954 RepID=A0ABQ6HRF4_9MICO|nr:regulatory protein RecX [Arsenicicoccus piscis]MCH8628820.1 recombination regulator RecX [Arsenicicoccus piscis]GMA20130.1 hypothetical protein GCM10025862_21510 [Arsenicicoccus piscis]
MTGVRRHLSVVPEPAPAARPEPARAAVRERARARRDHPVATPARRAGGQPGSKPEITPDVEHDIEPQAEEVARAIVLKALADSAKSRSQLRALLRRRGCADEVAEYVLDRLGDVGLVDDSAYAQAAIRSGIERKGLARAGLAHDLRRRGVASEVVDEVLDEVDPAMERRTARRLVDKKLRTMHGLGVDVQTRRLAGMLARKGYPSSLAYEVIRDAIADSPEYLPD